MTLTVPTAGNIAGRSADIRIAATDTGNALSEVGAKIVDLAGQWKAQRLQIEGQQAQLAITRDLGQARLEVEQLGDPTQIGPAWDAKVAEITDRYITKDESGQITIDPALAEQLGLTITELSDRHGLALSGKVINLNRSQQDAVWIEARDQITTAAVTADPETFGALVEQGEAWIDARVANGLMDPAAAAADKLALRQQVFTGRADAAIQQDPGAFLTAADAGEFDALGGDALSSRRLAAEREIARREKEAATAAEVAGRERADSIGRRLKEIGSIAKEGRVASDEAFLTSPEVTAHPDFAETMAAVSLRDEMPGIRQATPAELEAAIAAEEVSSVTHSYQTERLKVLRDWHDKAVADYGKDAVATAQKHGLPVPVLPTFDAADPEAFANGLAARLSFQPFMRDKGYTSGQAVFSEADRAALKPVLDPKADTGPKLALAEAIVAGSNSRPQDVTGLLDADPVFARATSILASTGNASLAEEMLRGQQKVALGTVALPTEKTMQLTFDDITGGIFNGSPAQKAQIMAAARAVYADGAAGLDPDVAGASGGAGWSTDPAAVDLFSASVQRVLGATPDNNGAMTVGGIQEINGAYVALPVGMAKATVEDTWDNLDAQLRGQRWNAELNDWDSSAMATPPNPLRAFKAAAIDGSVPDLGANPSGWINQAQLVRVGESDVYEMRITVDGRSYTVPRADDPTGTAFRFRLPALIREARK
jgi:hypothetical protein